MWVPIQMASENILENADRLISDARFGQYMGHSACNPLVPGLQLSH
jgi:hypothetical protein